MSEGMFKSKAFSKTLTYVFARPNQSMVQLRVVPLMIFFLLPVCSRALSIVLS